jgi:hypothetical protein
MRYAFILLSLLWLLLLDTVNASIYSVKLGDSTIHVLFQKHGSGKNFIHLHQSETTALKAARAVMMAEGGSILTLVHSGGRNISFRLDHRRYEFDPNRIFTDVGIKKTLMEFGPYSAAAHAEVNKLAQQIKVLLPKGKIIAVHNNKTYSFKNYLPGRDLSSEAKSLNRNIHHHYRNFYLVTKEKDYLRLKKRNFNSIWQAFNATDDGSLSVYLAHRRYINVEAGYEHLAEQINMLRHA